ncbi:chaperone protein dnaJ 1, mitochondrial-like isoform X2 [Durio zibethinus]|uniref:Chaperone protein dnaJ 1, mitochondrial-like isoform X2 n=1 Tax=Durio zibethinus TaxID=66656 RepID=A0A6P6AU17_DURZI|nr:chaperone protein dnaJ 1, mitochondrial-like isoform X2 [Durio zibethinus]
MGRFNWLRLCRRHWVSIMPVESAIDGGNGVRKFSTLFQSLNRERALHSSSFGIGKPFDFTATGMPPRERYFHATGSGCSAKQDYYEILGLPENATREEIKRAYHALAKKYHPDANKNNPSAKRKFQEIRDAYETLLDSEKRREYDRMHARSSENMEYGANDAEGFRFYDTSGAQGFRYTYQTGFSDSFSKIFSEIFQDEMDQFAPDIQTELLLSFSEAAKGCTKDLCFDAFVPCDSCDGRGYPPNAKVKVCPTCRGTGTVTIPPFTSTCNTCKGSGRIIKEYCMSCQGSGVVEGVKEVKVTLPAGVDSGDTIHVPEAGNIRRQGSQPGNLFIRIKVADDPVFARDGADVYVNSNISFTQAILGGKVEVPTLSGMIQVKIPEGCQHGQLLVLRGKGLPKHGFLVYHGDQYVCFRVNLPTAINDRQRAILEELAKEEFDNENDSTIEGSWHNTIICMISAVWHQHVPKVIADLIIENVIMFLIYISSENGLAYLLSRF